MNQVLIIWAGGLRQCEYEVCPTLLHMTSTGNQTPDLLISNPIPYKLGHMLPYVHLSSASNSYSPHYSLWHQLLEPVELPPNETSVLTTWPIFGSQYGLIWIIHVFIYFQHTNANRHTRSILYLQCASITIYVQYPAHTTP